METTTKERENGLQELSDFLSIQIEKLKTGTQQLANESHDLSKFLAHFDKFMIEAYNAGYWDGYGNHTSMPKEWLKTFKSDLFRLYINN